MEARTDEQTLIQAAQRGKLEAFNELVLIYQDQVYNLACRIMGESHAAADATQEAFISAYHGLKHYRGGSFKAWLMRIVTNACYDELRRRKRRPTSSLDALHTVDPAPGQVFADRPEDPESFAQRQDLNHLLEKAILTLPLDQRTALLLSDVQGYNYNEIAEITQTALGTVKSRISRARARLRDYLLAQGELLPPAYRL